MLVVQRNIRRSTRAHIRTHQMNCTFIITFSSSFFLLRFHIFGVILSKNFQSSVALLHYDERMHVCVSVCMYATMGCGITLAAAAVAAAMVSSDTEIRALSKPNAIILLLCVNACC